MWEVDGPITHQPKPDLVVGIPLSKDLFNRTRKFGIDHKEIVVPFKTEGTAVLFDTHVPS